MDYRKWADVLTGYCTAVQPGESVAISGGGPAEPLLREIYKSVVDKGGHPVLNLASGGLQGYLLEHGTDEQLTFIAPFEQFDREVADVSIRVLAESNTRALAQIDTSRSALYQKARADLFNTASQRAAAGKRRWSLTLFPTDAYAQDAEMSTDAFAEFIEKACKLDEDDPEQAWSALRTEQARLIDFLETKRMLRFVGPGTDLTAEVSNRIWINSDGKRNFPSGEVFTGPLEESVNGILTSSFPVVTAGRQIADIQLKFESGQVIDASASKNEEYLFSALDMDDGARRLGEIAIGTNFGITQFTGQILLDEKIGGTVHVALGQGYPETGSTNRSAIHWDLIVDLRDGGRVEADGEAVLVDGRFVV